MWRADPSDLRRAPLPSATLLDSAEFALKPVQIVLAGALDDTVFTELRRAIYRVSLPNRIVVAALPGCDLPPDNPAHGKGSVGGRPAAYVCEGPVCSLPLTEPQALVDRLASVR